MVDRDPGPSPKKIHRTWHSPAMPEALAVGRWTPSTEQRRAFERTTSSLATVTQQLEKLEKGNLVLH